MLECRLERSLVVDGGDLLLKRLVSDIFLYNIYLILVFLLLLEIVFKIEIGF